MGYLTTFTIYNDGIDQIKVNSDKFCEKLYQTALSSLDGEKTFGHGYHGNLVNVQKTRHADDHTCYVHMGNTVTEMNPYSKTTKNLMENHPEFFDNMLRHLEDTVKELKRIKKETKKS